MAYNKKLGIIVTSAGAGEAFCPLAERLTPEDDAELRAAFLADLLSRLKKLKSIRGSVFFRDNVPDYLRDLLPNSYEVMSLEAGGTGGIMAAALDRLLESPRRGAVVVDSVCPDVPVQYVKRAYTKLKHKDVVAGPTPDGRLYLAGLKAPAPGLFHDVDWDQPGALAETVRRVESGGLTLSVLPLWYKADSLESLRLLRDLISAKRLEKGGGVYTSGRVLADIIERES